jgi:hypothetical protein
MELEQKGWLKQPAARVVMKTASKEDLLWPVIRDHDGVITVARHHEQEIPVQEVWGYPRDANRCPLGGKQTVDPLDQ